MTYLVELEPGVWIADVDGDPGRTLTRDNAKRFVLVGALRALKDARVWRGFKSAAMVSEDGLMRL